MARTVAQERLLEVEEVEAPEEARRAAVGEEKPSGGMTLTRCC